MFLVPNTLNNPLFPFAADNNNNIVYDINRHPNTILETEQNCIMFPYDLIRDFRIDHATLHYCTHYNNILHKI